VTRPSASKRPITVGVWLILVSQLFGMTAPAMAGTGVADSAPDDANLGATTPERRDTDHWTLGAGAAVAPRFQGADKYELQPVPLIDVKYGRFFAKVGEGIGVNVIETPAFTAGASVNWMKGYDEDDVPTGVHGVDSALGARLFASARFQGVVATLAATQAVTERDRGLVVNAGLAYPITVTERLRVTPALGVSWANGKYMDSYFGIDSSESASSGLSRYEPSSGIKDVSLRINAGYRLTDSISAVGSVGFTHLLGEAGKSPLVKKRTQPLGLVGLTYTF
jgi:outer membrane protein